MALPGTAVMAEGNKTYRPEFESADAIKYQTPTTESDGNVLIIWNDDGYAQWGVDIAETDICGYQHTISRFFGRNIMKKTITFLLTLTLAILSICPTGFAEDGLEKDAPEYNQNAAVGKYLLSFFPDGGGVYVGTDVGNQGAKGTAIWNSNASVEWDVYIAESGTYDFVLDSYVASTICKPWLYIDGILTADNFTLTKGSDDYTIKCKDTIAVEIPIKKGAHKIKLFNSANLPNGFRSETFIGDTLILTKSGEYPLSPLGSEYEYNADEYSAASSGITTEDGMVHMSDSEWLEFRYRADKEEAYAVSANILSEMGAGITVEILNKSFSLNSNGYIELGHILIPPGDGIIRITACGTVVFKNLKFKKLTPGYDSGDSDIGVCTEFENYASAADVEKFKIWDYASAGNGKIVGSQPGAAAVYNDINIPEDGMYKLIVVASSPEGSTAKFTVNGDEAEIMGTLTSSGGEWHNYIENDLGIVQLSAGIKTISYTNLSGDVNLDCFQFEKIDTLFDAYSCFTGDTAVLDNRKIPRGTDSFTVYFTDKIKSTDNAAVCLSDRDEEIPIRYSIKENELEIMLKKTLDFSKEYTLKISGISGEYASMQGMYDVCFSTGDENEDDGVSSTKIEEKIITYEQVCISGTVVSSKNIGIEGRKVMLDVSGPNDFTESQSDAAVTEKDGKFKIEYDIPDGCSMGKYSFTVKSEYADDVTIELIYLSENDENALLGALNNTTDSAAVDEWFKTNIVNIGVDYNSDISTFNTHDVFTRHFVGKEYKNIRELLTDYSRYLSFETINSGNEQMIESILSDENKCAEIGIDYAASAAISTNRAGFIKDIAAFDDMQKPDRFVDEYNKTLNKWLAKEFEKADVSLELPDVNAYVGMGVTVPVNFSAAQSDVIEVALKIKCSNADIIKSLNVLGINADKVTLSNEDGENTILAELVDNSELKDFGNLQFTAPAAGNYKISFYGTVKFQKNDVCFETNILPKEINISVTKKTSYSQPSGSGGGSGGGSVPPIEPTEPPVKEPDKDGAFAFCDLEDVSWAEDSINYLLSKRIIAENEEKRFYPNRFITREEFVKMIITAIGAEDLNADTDFQDVHKGSWFYSYVASAQKNGIVVGDDSGNFGVGQNITRQDMAVILSRTLTLAGYVQNYDGTALYADDDEISEYAKASIYNMRKLGIMNGVGENICAPHENATRAMAAKLICGMMKVVGR